MDLILKCVNNHTQRRAHASEIVGRLAEMVFQFPASFTNRLDEALSREIRDLRDENRRTEALDKEIQDLQREIGDLREEKRTLREEMERKDREIQELRMENELLKIENKTTDLNLQNFSPSQVSLYMVIVVHAQDINFARLLQSPNCHIMIVRPLWLNYANKVLKMAKNKLALNHLAQMHSSDTDKFFKSLAPQ
jgi:FtsZ-binding cell division protein ZapB